MPEKQHAVCLTTGETAAVDHIGAPCKKRAEHARVLRGVVFEVGVLHDDEVGGGLGETSPQRCSLALIVPLMEHPHPRVVHRGENVAGAIGGCIVDDHHLGNLGPSQHRRHTVAHRGFFIEHRHNDAQTCGAVTSGVAHEITLAVPQQALRCHR